MSSLAKIVAALGFFRSNPIYGEKYEWEICLRGNTEFSKHSSRIERYDVFKFKNAFIEEQVKLLNWLERNVSQLFVGRVILKSGRGWNFLICDNLFWILLLYLVFIIFIHRFCNGNLYVLFLFIASFWNGPSYNERRLLHFPHNFLLDGEASIHMVGILRLGF